MALGAPGEIIRRTARVSASVCVCVYISASLSPSLFWPFFAFPRSPRTARARVESKSLAPAAAVARLYSAAARAYVGETCCGFRAYSLAFELNFGITKYVRTNFERVGRAAAAASRVRI